MRKGTLRRWPTICIPVQRSCPQPEKSDALFRDLDGEVLTLYLSRVRSRANPETFFRWLVDFWGPVICATKIDGCAWMSSVAFEDICPQRASLIGRSFHHATCTDVLTFGALGDHNPMASRQTLCMPAPISHHAVPSTRRVGVSATARGEVYLGL